MPRSSWQIPPDFRTQPEEFQDFLLELFNHVYGIGGDITGVLDTQNVPLIHSGTSDHTQGTDQFLDQGGANQVVVADAKDAVTKKHDPGTNHKLLKQATDPTNAGSSSVSVTSADADLTYSQNEVDLMNELKGDVNQLVTDTNAIVTKLNTLMANMRTASLIA